MRWLIPLAILAIGCGDPEKDDTDTPEGDTDTDTDADTDTDTDTDADTDTDVDLDSVTLTASATELSTRETVDFTLVANYGDGTQEDITAEAVFNSGDDEVLYFYTATEGQPLDGGTVEVTGSYGGLDDSVEISIELALATSGDLVINELLADATVDGDPNADGSTDSVEDEFVEIANLAGVSVDLGGVTIVENDWSTYLPRHTFAEGTVLKAGEAIVVFGGGDVSNMSADNVSYVTADNEDPGTQYGLSLLDSGETVRLVAADGKETITSLAYGSASIDGTVPSASDESITLDPDVSGDTYVLHSEATDSSGSFTPGTYVDGSAFPGPDGVYGG